MARDSRWKNQFELLCPEPQLDFEVRCCLYWYIIIPALKKSAKSSGQWPVGSTDHWPLATDH